MDEMNTLPEVESVGGDDVEADNAVLDRALRIVTGDREAAQKLHNDLSTEREESYRYYRGKALGNEREGRSRVVSSDVMDAVEWIMPSLMRIYFASDIVSCEPIGEEDTEAAERVAALLNYQFLRRGNGFTAAYKWFKDALVYGLGVLKITWEDRERTTSFRESELPQDEFERLSSDPKVRVRHFEEAPPMPPDEATLQQMAQSVLSQFPPEMPPAQQQAILTQAMQQMIAQMPKVFRNVYGTQRVMDYSGPVYEVIAPEDFYYDPEAEELGDARFTIHRVFRSPDYLRRMEDAGVYSNVQEALERQSAGKRDVQADAEKLERFAEEDRSAPWDQTVGIEDEQKRAPVEVWEWWGDFDPEDDGKMEPYVITVANDVVIRCEPNPYDHGETPFEVLRPILDVHKFEGISIADLVKEFQDVKTSLRRQILDNISWQNNGMWEVARGGGVDLESLKNPRPGGIVRVDIAGSIRPLTPPPLQQGPYMAMEFEQTQAEQRTGVTRYNQGLQSDSLNKMLALDTPIPLVDGSYKRNGDVVEGDIVIGSDGTGTKVLKAHPVQMPGRAFELTFKSGDVVRAGGEHRWSVKVCDGHYRNLSPEWEKLPTERIFDLMQSGHKVFIPRVGPVDFTEKKLPIPSYLLGAWLGDGNAHTNRFTTMDPEIVKAFAEWAEQFYGGGVEKCSQQHSGKATTYQLVNTPFRRMLKDLGVLKDSRYEATKGNVKHIPEIYLRGSFEQRLALLRGLMDTDGCIDKNGNAIFCNSEPALVEGFVRLVESLGGKPCVNWSEKQGHKFKTARPHAHVTFALAYCPASLPRKVRRWKLNPAYWERQAIVSIREIPIEPMRCLTVEAKDELYCCGRRLTLTLNTATGISAIMGASQQRLELIARLFAETGVQRTFVKSLALNRQFMNDQFVARLYNKPIAINRDDISGQFDILVSVGISAGQQEMRQQQLMQLLNMGPGLSQTGVMTPDNVYEVLCKLLQGWGFKDFQRYASDPQFVQQMQMQMQSLQQQLQQMQQQLQQSQAQTQQMGAILQHPAVAPVAAQVLQQQMAEQPPGAQQPPQQQMPPIDAQPVPQGPPMMIGSAV